MTSKVHSIDFFVDLLGIRDIPFLDFPGRYGWTNRQYYMGISLLYGGREDVCIELSGTGCRTLEDLNPDLDWFVFLSGFEFDIRCGDVNVSRLDIAGDDKSGLLQHRVMTGHCLCRKYICKAKYRIWIDGDEQQIYFGSPASDRRLRIYNKAMEQGIDDIWMRCEMQMRNKCAVSFLLNWFRDVDIGIVYSQVLRDFLRFTEDVPDGKNYDRAVICSWWDYFLGQLGSCPQLYLAGSDYSLFTVRNFLERQCSSSLKLFLAANGGDFQDLIDIIEHAKLNSRQLALLDRIRSERVE